MKTVLPYIGSKQRFFNKIHTNINKDQLYIEPFAGGFSLGLTLLSKGVIEKAILNDLDENVINFWKQLKYDYWALVNSVEKLFFVYRVSMSQSDVYDTKEKLDNAVESDVDRAALFYLYKRMNRGGAGKYVSTRINSYSYEYIEIFRLANELLEKVEITNKSFSELKEYDSDNTMWYLDPPYYNARNSLYYEECKETDFNHTELRDFINNLKGEVILSYDDCTEIRGLYNKYKIHSVRVPSKQSLEGGTNEVLISKKDLELGKHWGYQDNMPISERESVPPMTFADLLNEG